MVAIPVPQFLNDVLSRAIGAAVAGASVYVAQKSGIEITPAQQVAAVAFVYGLAHKFAQFAASKVIRS